MDIIILMILQVNLDIFQSPLIQNHYNEKHNYMSQKILHQTKSRPYNSLITGDSLVNALKIKNQQLQPQKYPIPKPSQDKIAENRSQSLTDKNNKYKPSNDCHYRQVFDKNVETQEQIDRYKSSLEAYQRQLKKLGQLFGNENMNIHEIKTQVQELILNRSSFKHIKDQKLYQRMNELQNQLQSIEKNKRKTSNAQSNNISKEFLKDLQEQIMRKSKILQEIASSANIQHISQSNKYFQKSKIDDSLKVRQSSDDLKLELQKKAKYIEQLNKQIERERYKYQVLNKSYQDYKKNHSEDEQAKVNGIWHQGIIKTPQQLIKQLNARDDLILQKTDRIHQLQREIKQLKQFIQKLKEQNRQLRSQLMNKSQENQKQFKKNGIIKMSTIYNQVNFEDSKINNYKDPTNSRTQLNPISQNNFDQNNYDSQVKGIKIQYQNVNNPDLGVNKTQKQKKSLFFRQPVISQNIIDPKSSTNSQNDQISNKNHIKSNRSSQINNSNQINGQKNTSNIKSMKETENININFNYPNNLQKSKKQISKIEHYQSQLSINQPSVSYSKININPQNLISQMNSLPPFQYHSSKASPMQKQNPNYYSSNSISNIINKNNYQIESIKVQYQRTKKELSRVSVELEEKKKILSQVLDRAKNVDIDISRYWERVSERENTIKQQYQNEIQKLKKGLQLLELQNNLAYHRIQEVKKEKQLIQISVHHNQSHPIIINTMKSLQSEVSDSKKEYIKLKAHLITQESQNQKQIQKLTKVINKLIDDLREIENKNSLLEEQKSLLMEKLTEKNIEIREWVNKYQILQSQYQRLKYSWELINQQLSQLKAYKILNIKNDEIGINSLDRSKQIRQHQGSQKIFKNKETSQRSYQQLEQQLNAALILIQNLKNMLKQKQQNIQRLKQRNEYLQTSNQNYEREAKSLQQQYQAFRTALHEQKDKIQLSINTRLQETSTNYKQLLQESNRLRIAQIMEIKAESQHKQQIINQITLQKQQLQANIQKIKHQFEQNRYQKQQKQNHLQNIIRLQQTVKLLQNQLDTYRQQVPQLQNNYKLLIVNISELETQRNNLRQQYKTLEIQISQIKRQTIPKYQRDLQFKSIENNKISQTLKFNQNEYNILRAQLREKNEKILQVQTSQSMNYNKYSQLQQNYKAVTEKLNWIGKQLEEKNKNILELSNKQSDIQLQNKRLKNELEIFTKLVQNQKKKFQKTIQQFQNLRIKKDEEFNSYRNNISQILKQNIIYNRTPLQSYNNLNRYLTAIFQIQLVIRSPQHSQNQIYTKVQDKNQSLKKVQNSINTQAVQPTNSLTDSQTSIAKKNVQSFNNSVKNSLNNKIQSKEEQLPIKNHTQRQSIHIIAESTSKHKIPQYSYSKPNVPQQPVYYNQKLIIPSNKEKEVVDYRNQNGLIRSTSERLLKGLKERRQSFKPDQIKNNSYQKNQYGQPIRREEINNSKERLSGKSSSSVDRRSKPIIETNNNQYISAQYPKQYSKVIQSNTKLKIGTHNKDQRFSKQSQNIYNLSFGLNHLNTVMPNISVYQNSMTSSGIVVNQANLGQYAVQNYRVSKVNQQKSNSSSQKSFVFNRTSQRSRPKNEQLTQVNKSKVEHNNALSESQQSGLHLYQKNLINGGGCCIDI